MTPTQFKQKAGNSIENVYESKHEYWDYFCSFTGHLNGNYFCIYFSSVDGRERIEISPLTDNINEFKKHFGL